MGAVYKSIESKRLNKVIDMGVVMPSFFNKIFIMLHGYGGSIKEVESLLPIEEYAETYNMLVVIPELGNKFYLDRRNIDGEKDFVVSDFLCKELPAFIISEYRLPEKLDIVLGGYSMGGFGAILHGLNHPGCFKGVISVSGAFIANEIAIGSDFVVGTAEKCREAFDIFMIKDGELPIDVLSENTDRNPIAVVNSMDEKRITQLPAIVLTCATKDIWYSTAQQMKRAMEERGIPFSYYEIVDGGHAFVEFDQGFRFAFSVIFGY